MSDTLIIRADAGIQMGTGHLMRGLALAQAWKQARGEVIFVTACHQPRLLQRLFDEKFLVHRIEHASPHLLDWQATYAIARHYPDAWIALDGYHFDIDYHRKVRNAGFPLLIIDDMAHLKAYSADFLLNQNPHAKSLRYPLEGECQMLLGPQYGLLRREFLNSKRVARKFSVLTHRLLITAGGTDPHNVTTKLLRSLAEVHDEKLEIVAVSGATNPNHEELCALADRSPHGVRVMSNVKDMSQLMEWADLAISAAGTTTLELACLGLPSLLMTLFNNQEGIGKAMDEAGAAINLGRLDSIRWETVPRLVNSLFNNTSQRREMSRKAQDLVDGEGANRVVKVLKSRLKKAA